MRICACRSDEHPQRYTTDTPYIPPNRYKAIAEPRALSQPTKRTQPGSKATRRESYACPNTRVNFDRKASYFFTYKGKRATQDRFKGQTKDISSILTLLKFTESLLIACKILNAWVKGLVISLSVYIVSAFFQQHLCTDHFPRDLLDFCIIPSMLPPSALIMSGTTIILHLGLLSESSNASCRCFVHFSFLFTSMLFFLVGMPYCK